MLSHWLKAFVDVIFSENIGASLTWHFAFIFRHLSAISTKLSAIENWQFIPNVMDRTKPCPTNFYINDIKSFKKRASEII